MGDIDVWIVHKRKVVKVTDYPGVPTEVTGYVSEEAKQAAESRGHATISEIGFNRDDWGNFETYGEAEEWATEKAKELGYEVELSYQDLDFDEDDYDDFDDEEDEDDDWDLWDTVEDDDWEDDDEDGEDVED